MGHASETPLSKEISEQTPDLLPTEVTTSTTLRFFLPFSLLLLRSTDIHLVSFAFLSLLYFWFFDLFVS